jgi:hypothetical protein
MRKHILAVMTAILVLALATAAMAADPFVGTWKMNVEKSTFNPGPPPKSSTTRIEATKNGLKFMMDSVSADGKATHSEGTWTCDGKDYPNQSNPGVTMSYTRIDTNTIVGVRKKDGKEIGNMVDVISKDDKTGTMTIKGKNAQGQDVNNTIVHDKQ